MDQLGHLAGLQVLDYGCGHGMAAVVMARRGARVTALDLSHGYLQEARLRAKANRVFIDVVRADGEHLPFASGAFDRIWGNAVLHHLDLRVAAAELFRVLRPGGVAVFCEPWGENPVLTWARRHLAFPDNTHTVHEQPLRQWHVQLLRRVFPQVDTRGFQLLSMAHRVLHGGRLTKGLDWWDAMLLARIPALGRLCRYIVITLGKEPLTMDS
jgi:SAM-dependent methyltransferase